MSVKQITLLSSAAQTATGQGGAIDVNTVTMLDVVVVATASSSLTVFDVWLEGSVDGGTNWYELLADTALEASGGADNTARTNERNIVDGDTTPETAPGIFYGHYKHLPCGKVRVAWRLTGTSATFEVKASGK